MENNWAAYVGADSVSAETARMRRRVAGQRAGEETGSWGGHGEKFVFHFKCSGKLLEGFKLGGHDMMYFLKHCPGCWEEGGSGRLERNLESRWEGLWLCRWGGS